MNSKKCMCLIVFLFTVTVAMFSFFAFAQETALPSVDSIVAVYENEKATKVKTEISNLDQNGTLIVALYKDGKLLSCKDGAVTSGTKACSLEFSDSDIRNADSAKAFIWDTLSGMKAISGVKEVSTLLPSGIVKLNYKRNDSGEQAFLYKFGTTGSKVEISIENNDDYKMSDLDISVVPVENKSKIVENGKTGFSIDIEQSTDTYKKINFTGDILGIVDLNISIKGTNIVQDTMRIEILKDYKNVVDGSGLSNSTSNSCLVPTLSNNGNFKVDKQINVGENCRFYGNDCTIDASERISSSVTYPHFQINKNTFVENVRFYGPYVDKIYKYEDVIGFEEYKIKPMVYLSDGAVLKNSYVIHGGCGVEIAKNADNENNIVLEDVTIECSPIPIKVDSGAKFTIKGNVILDNGVKSVTCSGHNKGIGIAKCDSETSASNISINIEGDLHSYNFIPSGDISKLNIKFPQNMGDNKIILNGTEYINPIAYGDKNCTMNISVSQNSNLYNLTSFTSDSRGKIFSYDKNKVAKSGVDLSYLLSKPEAYATEVEFETFKYTMSGIQNSYNAKLSENNVVDFSNVKFNKYNDALPYDMHVFEVTSGVEEEYVTTTYTLTNGLFDSTTKKLTLPSDASTSKEYYGIFEVTDIYDDNKQYSDYNTTIKCVE